MRVRRIAAAVAALLLVPALPGHARKPSPPPEMVVDEDTTWTKEGGPHVYGYVFVEGGVTLTVEPGVRVESQGIFVSGGLRAEGTPEEPIVFSGSGGPDWDGIVVWDVRGFRPASVIENVRIENAAVGLLMFEDAFPVHGTVFASNRIGLQIDNPQANLSFTGNEFYSNGIGFHGRTTGFAGLYENDFWDNRVSLFFQAQSRWACQNDPGIFDVHYNDILRGPSSEWFSFDVRTSLESRDSGMQVNASDNWWGTTDEEDIQARLEPQLNCCPEPDRAEVVWRDPAPVPQTATEPPGAVGSPAREPSGHGDPAYVVDVRSLRDGDCMPHGSVDRIRGTVSGAVMQTPPRLDVALVRFTGVCSSYDPKTGRFSGPGRCRHRAYDFFDVRVREGRWHVALRRPLAAGRYIFLGGDMPGGEEVAFRVMPR